MSVNNAAKALRFYFLIKMGGSFCRSICGKARQGGQNACCVWPDGQTLERELQVDRRYRSSFCAGICETWVVSCASAPTGSTGSSSGERGEQKCEHL